MIGYIFHIPHKIRTYFQIKKFNEKRLRFQSKFIHPEPISMGLFQFIGSYSSYKKGIRWTKASQQKIKALRKGTPYATHSR